MTYFDFFEDAGHAWMKVQRKDLILANCDKMISIFSFQNGNDVYLEEDCDASVFIQRYKLLTGNEVKLNFIWEGDYSKIRDMDMYKP